MAAFHHSAVASLQRAQEVKNVLLLRLSQSIEIGNHRVGLGFAASGPSGLGGLLVPAQSMKIARTVRVRPNGRAPPARDRSW